MCMKIGFIGLANPGQLSPMSAMARQLQSHTHDVVMFSPPVGESIARAAGLPFVPSAEREFSPDKLGEIVGTVSRLKGEEGLQFTVNAVAALNEVKWRTLPNLLSSTGIDALVVDNYDFYGEIIPMRLGMPYAIVSNALQFDYSGYAPLCVYDWAHENTPEAHKKKPPGRLKVYSDAHPQQRRGDRTSGESRNQSQLGGPILFVLGSPLDHTVSSGI